jgi:hypothetical protein
MNYVMLICSDGVPTPEKTAAMHERLDPYVASVRSANTYIFGHRLAGSELAHTVRVRDAATLVIDGPFAESKEFIAGFDLLDLAGPEAAVSTAASHPVSGFHCVEVRPVLADHVTEATAAPAPWLFSGPAPGRDRYAIFICHDGSALPDADEDAAVTAEALAWGDRIRAAGISPLTVALEPPEAAVTVRVREGQTIVSDGPFVEAKEFIAGLVVVDVASLDAAIALAAEHPVARSHRLEVRPFLEA